MFNSLSMYPLTRVTQSFQVPVVGHLIHSRFAEPSIITVCIQLTDCLDLVSFCKCFYRTHFGVCKIHFPWLCKRWGWYRRHFVTYHTSNLYIFAILVKYQNGVKYVLSCREMCQAFPVQMMPWMHTLFSMHYRHSLLLELLSPVTLLNKLP